MNKTIRYSPEQIAKKIVDYCLGTNKKFIFISGNGGSGKSELSKLLAAEAGKSGHANVLDMDDFVDTEIRKSGRITWNDKEKGMRTGRYTTSFAASYFLQNVKAIICNLSKGNDYYHWPKKAKNSEECRLLYGDAVLTIIEGVGTVFLERDKASSLGVFMRCDKDIEIERRVNRGKFSDEKNREDVLRNFEERNSQFEANILPYVKEFEVVLESNGDFSLNIMRDDDDLFTEQK
jgi:uridine kinase